MSGSAGWGKSRSRFVGRVAALGVLIVGSAMGAAATTVVVPSVGPPGYQYFGTGDASVTYDEVIFSQSAAYGASNLFNVSPALSGLGYAEVSSQYATPNILITLPSAATEISIDFGTSSGTPVDFTLSNGDSFTLNTASSNYRTPDVFTFDGAAFSSVQMSAGAGDILDVSQLTFGTPEPATWAMMMVGVGLIGGVLRRRAAPASA